MFDCLNCAAIRRPVDRDFPFRFEEYVKKKVCNIWNLVATYLNYNRMRFWVQLL